MKKPVRWILRISLVAAGIIFLSLIVFFTNFYLATKKMTPSETQAINDSVWSVKDRFVNAYLFKTRNGYVLFDAGMGEKNFSAELSKLGILPSQIKSVFLTHSDGDHTGATGLFKDPVIYMHRDEEQMVNGSNGKSKFFRTKWKYGPYKLLNSNDTITIDGLAVKIIHTPGHTPGSACYIVGKEYFVTGDNLNVRDGSYEHFTEKFNMDTPRQSESLKGLPAPGTFKYILTAHTGIVRIAD